MEPRKSGHTYILVITLHSQGRKRCPSIDSVASESGYYHGPAAQGFQVGLTGKLIYYISEMYSSIHSEGRLEYTCHRQYVLVLSIRDHDTIIITREMSDYEHDRATAEIRQGQQRVAQRSGDADPGMHKITQHKQALRRPRMAEVQQGIEGSLIPITGHGDAMGLEHLGLAQMKIGHEQFTPLSPPQGALGQERQTAVAPRPLQWGHEQSRSRICSADCI